MFATCLLGFVRQVFNMLSRRPTVRRAWLSTFSGAPGPGMDRPVGVYGERDDAEINPQPVFRLELIGFGDVAGRSEYPLAADKAEIDLTLAIGHQSALVFAHHDRNHDAAVDRPQTDSTATTNGVLSWARS